jgi:phosphoenolpyruvate carboxylase
MSQDSSNQVSVNQDPVNREKGSDAYKNQVELKYQLYNSLFLTLPLDAVEQASLLLPLLEEASSKGLEEGQTPLEIIDNFLEVHRPGSSERERSNFLFKVIQYVERQVALLDALEDAALVDVQETETANRLRVLMERVERNHLEEKFSRQLDKFGARVILTAHPTQFYPGPVLGIIADLAQAIKCNDVARARDLLQQLGNTPFYNKEKPTPYDEAIQLSWYLSNIFYPVFGEIIDSLIKMPGVNEDIASHVLSVGFWPGGDRDGNPFVTTDTTRRVAEKLRSNILGCYHRDIRELKRRLSFSGVHEELTSIEQTLYSELSGEVEECFSSIDEILARLDKLVAIIRDKHQGLYLDLLLSFRRKIRIFGFHFASLDIRQDSRVLRKIFETVRQQTPGLLPDDFDQLPEAERIEKLLAIKGEVDLSQFDDALLLDTFECLRAIKDIQKRNQEAACHRYIISNCAGALDIATLIALFRLAGWADEELTVDMVPLFETIRDLSSAGESMKFLYEFEPYQRHLARRKNQQTVMLGFSDGTKDGGYLMANWAIYRAKEDITAVSRDADIEVIFFDGRGGPPARGGGSTYKFYAALGRKIESNHIHLTVQGQTISSYYGTRHAATHNARQLLAAGLENNLFERPERELSDSQRELIVNLADRSYAKYTAFKEHPLFLPYLEQMSTLHYYAQSNIGSRPAKRGGDSKLKFEDLRAIPFVGAWGQLKQNVPGFYGVGSALKELEDEGRLDECKDLFRNSRFFEALIENSMQSMCKTNFQLTAYMKNDPVFGEFWQMIYEEFLLSREMVLKVSGQKRLLEDNPGSRMSIALRQQVVMPLLLIQQYALMKLNSIPEEEEESNEMLSVYEKMIVRTLFGNINASRNNA